MYILEFLKGQRPEQPGNEVITCEYRLLCSGEIYNGDVETLEWRKSTECRLLLTSPFTVFVASTPLYGTIPQELALRFTTQMVTEKREKAITSYYMFCPDDEIAKDIAALLCLFCRRLITICAKVRELYPNQPEVVRDWPIDFVNSLKAISWKRHPATSTLFPNGTIQVIDYNPPLKALSPKKLKRLFLALPDLPCAESIIRSARLYALALERIYQDTDIAYQLLISSVETIANAVRQSYTPTEAEMIKTKSNVADLAVEFGLLKEKAKRLAVEACKDISWTKQKFFKFLLENVSDALWTADDLFKLPTQFPLPNKDDFKAAIDEIYDARSKALHSGGSFPASASIVTGPMLPAKTLFELDITKRPFPPVSWFERVVNTAIQGFVERAIGANEKSTAK
jgi:hypothetical protein